MPIKPIAAGTPQRIIAKINEIVGAVNTGGGGGGGGGSTVHLVQLALVEGTDEETIVDAAPLNAALAEFQDGKMPLVAVQAPNAMPTIRQLGSTSMVYGGGMYSIIVSDIQLQTTNPATINKSDITFTYMNGQWNVNTTYTTVEIPTN